MSLDRRSFIRTGLRAGAASTIVAAAGTVGRSEPASAAQAPAVAPFELEEATIADLQKRMESGQDSARSLVEQYLARIEALDKRGPALRPRHRD